MNMLNGIGQQIADLFKSMTPSARIMAGLMVGVIVVSMGWIVSGQKSTSTELLFGGREFSTEELDTWEATFGEAGLTGAQRRGRRLEVPSAEREQYLKALASAKVLPREWGSYVDEAMSSGSPFDPNSLIERRFQTAEERELAAVIKNIPGIDEAAVNFDEHRQGFGRKTERVCSIAVKGRLSQPIPISTLKLISQHASTYFSNLPEQNITVTDLGGEKNYRASGDPNSAEDNPYLAAVTRWEEVIRQKVLGVVSNYGDIQLAVNVELDPTLREESEKLQYDPTAVTVQSTNSRKDFENSKAAPAGPPGAASNGVSNQPASLSASNTGQSSKTKESEENEKRIVGSQATVSKTAPLVPQKVTVSVGIPESYYYSLHRFQVLRDKPDATDAELVPDDAAITALEDQTKENVKSALAGIPVGIREGDDREPFITVYSYTDLPLPPLPEPGLAETGMAWLADSWSTLALIGLVVVSLGMMFNWVKSQGESDADRRFAEGFGIEVPDSIADSLELSEGEEEMALDANGNPTKSKFEMSGEEVKEDLSALIKSNPEAAVNLLKTWIGDAA